MIDIFVERTMRYFFILYRSTRSLIPKRRAASDWLPLAAANEPKINLRSRRSTALRIDVDGFTLGITLLFTRLISSRFDERVLPDQVFGPGSRCAPQPRSNRVAEHAYTITISELGLDTWTVRVVV